MKLIIRGKFINKNISDTKQVISSLPVIEVPDNFEPRMIILYHGKEGQEVPHSDYSVSLLRDYREETINEKS